MKLNEILTEGVPKTFMGELCHSAWNRIVAGKGSQADIDVIATNPRYAYDYAKLTGSRFPEGEDAVIYSSWWSYQYAVKILRNRWPEAESQIFKDSTYGTLYVVDLGIKYPECKEHVNKVLQDSEFIQDEYTAYKELCQAYFANNSVLMNKWIRYAKNIQDMS